MISKFISIKTLLFCSIFSGFASQAIAQSSPDYASEHGQFIGTYQIAGDFVRAYTHQDFGLTGCPPAIRTMENPQTFESTVTLAKGESHLSRTVIGVAIRDIAVVNFPARTARGQGVVSINQNREFFSGLNSLETRKFQGGQKCHLTRGIFILDDGHAQVDDLWSCNHTRYINRSLNVKGSLGYENSFNTCRATYYEGIAK